MTRSLFSALRRGESFHDIRSIVDWRPDSVREPDRSSGGLLALHEAVARGAPRNVVTFLHWRWLGAIRTMAGRDAPGLPLHYVSSVSAVESVAFLVDRYPGALGIKNGGGMIPLHVAIKVGAPLEIIELMLQRRPDSIRERADDGRLPAHFAAAPDNVDASNSNSAVMRYVLRKWPQAAHERAEDGLLPVHHAIRRDGARFLPSRDNARIVRFLLERLPGPDQDRDGTRSGLMHFAIQYAESSTKNVRAMARAAPESLLAPDALGRVPVHAVVARYAWNQHNLVWTLAGLCPRALLVPSSRGGNVALHEAIITGEISFHPSMAWRAAEILLDFCPESLKVKGDGGRLPLHAAAARRYPSLDLVRRLVEPWPGSLLVRDDDGNVPLVVAASNPTASLDVVHYLLAKCPGIVVARGGGAGGALAGRHGRSYPN